MLLQHQRVRWLAGHESWRICTATGLIFDGANWVRVTAMRVAAALLACLVVTGCSGKLVKATRAQAAADFKCSEDQLTITGDQVYGKYRVSGCDQKGVYSAECVFGNCKAERLRGE